MIEKALYTKYFVLAADLEKQTKYFQHKMMENAISLKNIGVLTPNHAKRSLYKKSRYRKMGESY